jgi:hypothetical protein
MSGNSPERACSPCMRMDYIELACAQMLAELAECPQVRPGVDPPASAHLAQPNDLKPFVFGTFEQ